MRYTVSKDALVAHLAGEAVVLHAGTKDYFKLNETGQVVWRMLEQNADIEAILDHLSDVYDVTAADARPEVVAIIGELVEAGLLIDSGS